jgi:Putative zinc-binding metallo-peptidase
VLVELRDRDLHQLLADALLVADFSRVASLPPVLHPGFGFGVSWITSRPPNNSIMSSITGMLIPLRCVGPRTLSHPPSPICSCDSWLPFVFAINSVSRAMGEHDLYPFVIAPPVVKKLGFVHDLIHGQV